MLNNFKDIFRSLRYVDRIHLINSHSPYKSDTAARRTSDNVLVSYHKAVSTRWSLVYICNTAKKTSYSDQVNKYNSAKMFQSLYFTQITAYLLGLVVVVVVLVCYDLISKKKSKSKTGDNSDDLPEPPSPRSFPIIGHMHLLGGYEVPYQAFTQLGKKYGNVVKLRLGSVNCVVVNEQENIREVLITKGNHFDSRPNFERYQQLFCGNRGNCKS